MTIYQVTQGLVTPGNVDYINIPSVKYYRSYADALKARGHHGGELKKYEDCHDSDFANREVWVERKIPSSFPDFVDADLPPENIQTTIVQIEVN